MCCFAAAALPTGVLCRGLALKFIWNNLDCILEEFLQYADSATPDLAAKAQGFAKVVGHRNFVVGLKCYVAVHVRCYAEDVDLPAEFSQPDQPDLLDPLLLVPGALTTKTVN